MGAADNDLARIWFDGCFDMMHYGHANALRQAKEMGDWLVVGLHSDDEISKSKGPPVCNYAERHAALEACKWVDQIVLDAPYTTDLAMMDEYGCELCVHGDDLTINAEGKDSYEAVKQAGRFRECKRTPTISTTELVGRMLLMTKTHHEQPLAGGQAAEGPDVELGREAESKRSRLDSFAAGSDAKSPYTSVSAMLPTSRRIVQFSSAREAKPTDRVVYVDGVFDLFHAGHCELLKKAREMGDFVLVGIHDDATANRIKGCNYPIMNLHERALSVLSCKYVDEVIIGAPYSVTKELLQDSGFNITCVVHGKTAIDPDTNEQDPYALPKQMGIYREVETRFAYLSTETLVERILSRRQAFEERNRKKQAKELAAIQAAEERAKSAVASS